MSFSPSCCVVSAARGSLSRELDVGWVAEVAVALCVVSSSESECCELLYLSELRVVLCKFSGSSNPWVATQTSGSLAGVREVGSLQLVSERGSTEICKKVCAFPAGFMCVLQVGCSCCYVARVASVVTRRVRAVVARLAMDLMAVVFPCRGRLQASPGAVLLDCSMFVSVVAVLPQGLRCAVGLASAFQLVFPELCLGGSGGGSPKTGLHCFYLL
ncbi:hypothetical protein Taro_035064 [Colocasia esculenta]|uniref:Uncharacterized protein n=1 Tax=Colocasia esculenta TaxID=4460 RepID=A0A843VT91_COLES|nr:hypothetical protein [Colocasia esculenta]